MTDQGPRSITRLLESLPGGDPGALAELWDRVQEELRVIAEGKLRRERRPRPSAALESNFFIGHVRSRSSWLSAFDLLPS